MDTLTHTFNQIQHAIQAGRRSEAQGLAVQLSEQWPHLADGWLLRSWLAEEPLESLRFAQQAARLEASEAIHESVEWSREQVHVFFRAHPEPTVPPPTARRHPSDRLVHSLRHPRQDLSELADELVQGLRAAPAAHPRATRGRGIAALLIVVSLLLLGMGRTGVALPQVASVALPAEGPSPQEAHAAPVLVAAAEADVPSFVWRAAPLAISRVPLSPPSERVAQALPRSTLARDALPPAEFDAVTSTLGDGFLALPNDSAAQFAAPDRPQPIAAPPVALPEDRRYALWPTRTDPEPYVVRENDTIDGLATRFGLQPTTILWANEELDGAAELLRLEQSLLIPPLDGVLHVVQPGDTLQSIGQSYGGIDPALIAWFPGNHLEGVDSLLQVGQRIMVPGGRKAVVVQAAAPAAPQVYYNGGQGYLSWPTGGWITTVYGYTHGGIDIAAAMGTPIFAAERGEIVFSGWNDQGYGFSIVVDHHNGWSTRYAHLSGMYYPVGTWVERGQLIGLMGSTGRSTGPHLHFEVMYYGYRYNPLDYLSR